jgi:hypothetical protein
MSKRVPSQSEITTLRDAGDVAGLMELYAAAKRRDLRRPVLGALVALGDEGRATLLGLLGDEDLQRKAGAVLVELGEDSFSEVAAQLDSDDAVRRRGALYTVYLYARYRDLPAAHDLLRTVAADTSRADLAGPATEMSAQVERLTSTRNDEIDRQLARISASLTRMQQDRGSTIMRMYSTVHSGRTEARAKISAMRYAGVRHVISKTSEYGEAVVGPLLALALEELGGGIVPLIEEALPTADKRTRGMLIATLICLRRARIPGAADALERSGVPVTEAMDRRAASIYAKWVRER